MPPACFSAHYTNRSREWKRACTACGLEESVASLFQENWDTPFQASDPTRHRPETGALSTRYQFSVVLSNLRTFRGLCSVFCAVRGYDSVRWFKVDCQLRAYHHQTQTHSFQALRARYYVSHLISTFWRLPDAGCIRKVAGRAGDGRGTLGRVRRRGGPRILRR